MIEAYPREEISAEQITRYLAGLAPVLDMKALIEPVTHRSDTFGWAGWTHWETSGAHFYAWEQPILFYSVDIYTCKAFDPLTAVEYTKEFFDSDDAVYKEF
ncbi:S-adenosylmethionine decarboxylase [Cryobacterium fucosi]|uniref:S-adenosylmethionine decarboxylase n=1 Tax=Cryobacterium fucosi TaxID=1259157 RepID=UPI0018E0919F|nr:S-adenosylmethionine decarboxylase [Cryobacterium fucosi]